MNKWNRDRLIDTENKLVVTTKRGGAEGRNKWRGLKETTSYKWVTDIYNTGKIVNIL